MSDTAVRMTAGRLLARNSALNLLGHAAPLVVALVAIPLLVTGLGTERFGILTLAWMAIGYFSLFDFGLGRALTQLVAAKLGVGEDAEIPALIWTAEAAMLVLGAVGAAVLALLAPSLVTRVLNVPPALQQEAVRVFHLLALATPWVVGTTGLRGVLEAKQRFGLVNAVRVPMGVLSFLGPVAVLPFSSSLVPVVAVLAVVRLAAWVVHLALCLHVVPEMRRERRMVLSEIGPLARFGGWMTVTNVVSPIMVYFDRFLIGAVLTMSAVAYYATPYEVVAKMWLFPAALLGVFFPAFALARNAPARLGQLTAGAMRLLIVLLFPATLLVVTLAGEGLSLWLGQEFARHSTVVLQLLAIGVFVNSIAQVPFTLIQGIGRPDLTGKLHLLEIGPYLAAVWLLTARFGIEGTAAAWLGRVVLDTGLLFYVGARAAPGATAALRQGALAGVPAIAALCVGALIDPLSVRSAYLLILTPSFAWLAWTQVLTGAEREIVKARLNASASRAS